MHWWAGMQTTVLCDLFIQAPGVFVVALKTTSSNWDRECILPNLGQFFLTNLHWSIVCCLLLVSDLVLQFWPYSQSLGWRNQSSTNWPTAFHDDGVYKSVRRTFSYAPRKMKPPMLMNVTLGMLPANSLQTGWENIKARVSNNSLFKLVINYKIRWLFTIKNTSTFVEKKSLD